MRVKGGKAAHRQHKKLRKQAKGYQDLNRKTVKKAKETLLKAGAYAYRDRKNKKRDFRRLWILRLSAAAKERGSNYSQFINGLKKHKIEIDRKILSDLAITDPKVFDKIYQEAFKA